MRQLINFFQKKKVFFYTMIIVATSKEDIVRTFSYVSLIKKKRPQFNFSRQKVEKVCFHEKNNVFFTNVSPQNLLVTAHTSKLKMFRWQKLRQFSILLDFFWVIIPYDGLMFLVMIDESWRSFSQLWIQVTLFV